LSGLLGAAAASAHAQGIAADAVLMQSVPAKPVTPPAAPGTAAPKTPKPADPPKPSDGAAPTPAPAPGAKPEYVKLITSMGDVVIELNAEKAPISVANFLRYVDKGHYDGTIFHRVIPSFMLQGGGFTSDFVQKPTDAPIVNEWKNGLKNVRGSVAMARLPAPDSATSQFFINVVDNPRLDAPMNDPAAYAVFGKVVSGMDVVDRIRDVPTGTKDVTVPGQPRTPPFQFVPLQPVVMTKVTRTTAPAAAAPAKEPAPK